MVTIQNEHDNLPQPDWKLVEENEKQSYHDWKK
jgi:hypothetical protein